MMEEVADLSSDQEGRNPKSREDIVKEVASALEEEEILKDENTTSKRVTSGNTPTSLKQASNESYVKVGLSASMLAATLPESPSTELIRPNSSSPSASDAMPTSATSNPSTTWQKPETLSSPLKGVKIENQDPEEDQRSGGVWGWMSSAVNISGTIIQSTQNLGKNLVEKTKNSVDTVITTLDPGMEDYLHGRGQSVTLTLACEDCEVSESMKDGFRQVFEHAAIKCQPSVSNIAPLPVGHSAGLKATQHRIMNLRRTKKVTELEVVIGVEEMIAELVPGKWFGMTCLCLSDQARKIEVETFSQTVAIPGEYVKKAEQITPSNYSLRWSGLSFTLGEIVLGNGQSSGDWQSELSGSSKRQILTSAARTLAGQYRAKLKASVESVMEKAVQL